MIQVLVIFCCCLFVFVVGEVLVSSLLSKDKFWGKLINLITSSSVQLQLTFLPFFFCAFRKKGQQPRLITIKSYTEICIEAGE